MADWDADGPRLAENLKGVLRAVRDHARSRALIRVDDAKDWHRQIMRGLDAPNPEYVGGFRGERGLETIGVRIGGRTGTPPGYVAGELSEFQRRLTDAVKYLDELIPVGSISSDELLNAVLDACGWAHAEWVRIHPFANGNGRTARVWANLIAMRYGLPPFVRLRPRPEGDPYAGAGVSAMDGDWVPTADLLRELLEDFLSTDG